MDNRHNGFKRLADVAGDHLQNAGADTDTPYLTRSASAGSNVGGTAPASAAGLAETHVGDPQDMFIEYVRERPLRAIGWAAMAGFAIGVMAAR